MNSGLRACKATHPVHFALAILVIRFSWTICPCCPWTLILSISASQEARVTGTIYLWFLHLSYSECVCCYVPLQSWCWNLAATVLRGRAGLMVFVLQWYSTCLVCMRPWVQFPERGGGGQGRKLFLPFHHFCHKTQSPSFLSFLPFYHMFAPTIVYEKCAFTRH
jgi:hypothetical protein